MSDSFRPQPPLPKTPDGAQDFIELIVNYSQVGSGYQIPEFQREFSWGINEITMLVDDINEVQESTPEEALYHFMGPMVRVNTAGIEGKEHAKIIDGQQRITALMLYLLAILNHCRENNCIEYLKNYANLYDFRDMLEVVINTVIMQTDWKRDKSAREDVIKKEDKTRLIHRTDDRKLFVELIKKIIVDESYYDYKTIRKNEKKWNEFGVKAAFKDFVIELESKKIEIRNDIKTGEDELTDGELEKFKKHYEKYLVGLIYCICRRLYFIPINLDSNISSRFVGKIFEVLNNRGKPLEDADLINAWLINGLDEVKTYTIGKEKMSRLNIHKQFWGETLAIIKNTDRQRRKGGKTESKVDTQTDRKIIGLFFGDLATSYQNKMITRKNRTSFNVLKKVFDNSMQGKKTELSEIINPGNKDDNNYLELLKRIKEDAEIYCEFVLTNGEK